jgi:soluble lytic murein transglycosylase
LLFLIWIHNSAMKLIRTLIVACLSSAVLAGAVAQTARGDELLVEMNSAFKRGDKKRLSALLPSARGHALEPWAVYWEMRARLDEASAGEIQSALQSIAGSYQEDRLRADWLLQLGKQRDFTRFAEQYPLYRMRDEKSLRCYELYLQQRQSGSLSKELAEEVKKHWYSLRDAEEGCSLAAESLYATRQLSALDIWREARLSVEGNRNSAASKALAIVSPDAAAGLGEAMGSPARFLTRSASSAASRELAVLALIKLASSDPDGAAHVLEARWQDSLSAEQRSWAWGVIAKQVNLKLDSRAFEYASKAANEHLNDDLLAWKARAALRQGARGWSTVLAAVNAMSDEGAKDPTWVYWKARALKEAAKGKPERINTAAAGSTPTLSLRPELQEAQSLLESIASVKGFYEQLATEELGRQHVLPSEPAPLGAAEKEAARLNAGLNRALYAIAIGIRAEGVREWNYSVALHTPGGMSERELLAASDFACQREVWDRCINTSERTKAAFSAEQRFPMPFRDAVVRRSREISLDPAYVYGLIRQESRFIMDARSGVGASGLMQVMPATARWTAKKIGMEGFTADQINNRDVNIAIGTAYLKFVLDDFQGSAPLAAAAYNAGPSRPRAWRNGPAMEGAAWAENVPFAETRDYVKKVGSNALVYGLILGAQPVLKNRMGTIAPREGAAPEPNKDLP